MLSLKPVTPLSCLRSSAPVLPTANITFSTSHTSLTFSSHILCEATRTTAEHVEPAFQNKVLVSLLRFSSMMNSCHIIKRAQTLIQTVGLVAKCVKVEMCSSFTVGSSADQDESKHN